ncbi:MAG: D-alanine--D-alanine ligase [Actinomycetia bacterium]|nr:D-alanine--D-alanine ligase [Actinomycetes bacterium]
MGGSSFEREFSLASGRHVLRHLEARGHTVLPLDAANALVETLRRERPDVAYIALHGGHGEDGTIQSLLEYLEIPFVGSLSSVCRLTWDKSLLPLVVSSYRKARGGANKAAHWPRGICLSAYAFKDLGAVAALDLITKQIPSGYPLAVMPAAGGSAMGVSKVTEPDELAGALLDALSFDDEVLVEEWVDGAEIAVCIIGSGEDARALAAIEIAPHAEFFDTAARLDPDFVDYYVPVREESLAVSGQEAANARDLIAAAALEVHQAFGCRDLSRVDLYWDPRKQQPLVMEINASPGMSEFSLFPMACEASGIDFEEMLDHLLETAVARQK